MKADQFFKMVDDPRQHNVNLFDSLQRKQSLVECLLMGSRTETVIIVGYKSSDGLCRLYTDGDGGIDLPEEFDYYKKNKVYDFLLFW